MARRNIIGISGSLTRPSRTTALIGAILDQLAVDGDVRLVELVDEAPHLFTARPREPLSGGAEAIVEAVEIADLLVVASPVYRASYTGALKHLFDIVDHRALQGTPVLLAATGGTPLHGLMIEHQLRPLFGFFNALTLPTAIFALESDFEGHTLTSESVRERIGRAVAEARHQLVGRLAPIARPAPMRHAAEV